MDEATGRKFLEVLPGSEKYYADKAETMELNYGPEEVQETWRAFAASASGSQLTKVEVLTLRRLNKKFEEEQGQPSGERVQEEEPLSDTEQEARFYRSRTMLVYGIKPDSPVTSPVGAEQEPAQEFVGPALGVMREETRKVSDSDTVHATGKHEQEPMAPGGETGTAESTVLVPKAESSAMEKR